MLGGLSFHGAAVSAQALFLGAQLLTGFSMARGAVSLIWRGLQALKDARPCGMNMGARDRPRLKRLGNKSFKEPLWKSWKKKSSASRGGVRSHLCRRTKRSTAVALDCNSFMDAFHSFIGRPSVKDEPQTSGASLKEVCMDDSGLPEDLAELEGNLHEGDSLIELLTRQNHLPGLALVFEVQANAEDHLPYGVKFAAVLKASVSGLVESARASSTIMVHCGIASSFWSYSLPGSSGSYENENIELSLAAAGVEMGRWYTVSQNACERFKNWSREGRLVICLEAYTGLRENICSLHTVKS